MPEEIGLFEAIETQRAIRHFKPDTVPDEDIDRLIYAATKAPSGANRQPWKFIVIRDSVPEALNRRPLHSILDGVLWRESRPPRPSSSPECGPRPPIWPSIFTRSPYSYWPASSTTALQALWDGGSSIYPAVQNILLAARALGLGSVITTLHKRYEDEIKDLLHIPDNVETAALLPVGYPEEGVSYGSTRRAPVEEVTYLDRWGASSRSPA